MKFTTCRTADKDRLDAGLTPSTSKQRADMESNLYTPLIKVMDLLLDAICVVDAEGRFVFASAACERIFGYTPAELAGRRLLELVHPDDRARTQQAAREIMAGEPKLHFENRYIRKDGSVAHITWSARWSEADQVRLAVARDVTELRRAGSMQSALHAISEAAHSAEDLLALFRRIHQIIGELLPAANFFVALYDGKKDELSFPYYVDEHDTTPAPQKLDSGTLSAKVIRSGEALLVTPDNRCSLPDHVIAVHGMTSLDWLGVPLSTPNGVIGALVVQSYSGKVRYSSRDMVLLQFVSIQVAAAIERKQVETRLRHMARHDALTGLPNREWFYERMQQALVHARQENTCMALLYIDLDRFKQVNDQHGHAAGDLLLQQVAVRIRQCTRELDTIGRIGGDEFVVLLGTDIVPEQAAIVAEKIRINLSQPFDLAGHCQQISCSIGAVVYPEHGLARDELMQQADAAMYVAKKQGGNRLQTGGVIDPVSPGRVDPSEWQDATRGNVDTK